MNEPKTSVPFRIVSIDPIKEKRLVATEEGSCAECVFNLGSCELVTLAIEYIENSSKRKAITRHCINDGVIYKEAQR